MGDAAGGKRPEAGRHPETAPAAGTPSRQTRNRLRTRARIMDAAFDLFSRQGYENTTIHEIADAADIALRTFYYHFDSKANLAMAWFQDWSDDFAAAVDSQPADADPGELLAGALRQMAAKGYPGRATWTDAEGRPAAPPPMQALFAETDPALAGVIYARLVSGFRRLAGVFRVRLGFDEDALEPYALASSVLAVWFVAIHGTHDALARGRTPPSGQEVAQRTFALYAEGLGPLWKGPS